MDDWQKYARARDQLHHLVVELHRLDDKISKKHRTPELQTCLEAMVRLVNEALAAFENGEVMAVQIDRYHQSELPGFEETSNEMKNPYRVDKD